MANIESRMRDAVGEYLLENGKVDAYDIRIGSLAHLDLLFGPLTLDDGTEDEDYARLLADGIIDVGARLNFRAAMSHIANVDIPTLYYDDDCGMVSESEPQGEELETGETDDDGEPIMEWCEPMPYYEVSSREAMAALYGREVPQYI